MMEKKYSVEQIVQQIESYIRYCCPNTDYSGFTISTTDDPVSCLFTHHPTWLFERNWIFRQADSIEDAEKVKRLLIGKGMSSLPVKDEPAKRYVICFLKNDVREKMNQSHYHRPEQMIS
jgi:hypothetical protein